MPRKSANYEIDCDRTFNITKKCLRAAREGVFSFAVSVRCTSPYGDDLGVKTFRFARNAFPHLLPGDVVQWSPRLNAGTLHRESSWHTNLYLADFGQNGLITEKAIAFDNL